MSKRNAGRNLGCGKRLAVFKRELTWRENWRENWREMRNRGKRGSIGGFTLVELLAVVTIMLLVLGMTLPSLDSMMSGGGRKGATVMSMNLFEQARAIAIQTGVNTYVGVPLGDFPSEEHRFRSLILFRDFDPEIDPAPTGGGSAPKYVPLTRWYILPKGVSFKQMPSSFLGVNGVPDLKITVSQDDRFPLLTEAGIPADAYQFAAIQWTPTGMIQQPTNRKVFLYEGQFLNDQETVLRQANRFSGNNATAANFYDELELSQFTGRPQLRVATFQ